MMLLINCHLIVHGPHLSGRRKDKSEIGHQKYGRKTSSLQKLWHEIKQEAGLFLFLGGGLMILKNVGIIFKKMEI